MPAGAVDDVYTIGVPRGAQVHVVVVGERAFVGHTGDFTALIERKIADKNLAEVVGVAVAAKDQVFAIRAERCLPVVAGGFGQLDQMRSIGVHDIQIVVAIAGGGEAD